MIPRGLRNNNPGNIRKSDTPWRGKIAGDDAEFETFDTPQHGIRAMAKLLLSYQDKHGLNTAAGIVNRWAPPVENDTGAYVNAVARAMGVGAVQTIDLHGPVTLAAMVTAMIGHENGQQPYPAATIAEAAADALGLAVPVYVPTQPAAPIEHRDTVAPQEKPMGLLAALLPTVLSLFAPRAQALLGKVTGQPADVVQPFLADLFGKIGAVTGQANPVQAVAALQTAPQETVDQVQEHALDYLDKIAPMVDKLIAIDKAKWTADDASVQAARDFTPRGKDIAPSLVSSSDWAFGAALVGMIALVGLQMYYDPQHKPDTTLVVILTGLILGATRVFERPFVWRFGGQHTSDATVAVTDTIAQANRNSQRSV